MYLNYVKWHLTRAAQNLTKTLKTIFYLLMTVLWFKFQYADAAKAKSDIISAVELILAASYKVF